MFRSGHGFDLSRLPAHGLISATRLWRCIMSLIAIQRTLPLAARHDPSQEIKGINTHRQRSMYTWLPFWMWLIDLSPPFYCQSSNSWHCVYFTLPTQAKVIVNCRFVLCQIVYNPLIAEQAGPLVVRFNQWWLGYCWSLLLACLVIVYVGTRTCNHLIMDDLSGRGRLRVFNFVCARSCHGEVVSPVSRQVTLPPPSPYHRL